METEALLYQVARTGLDDYLKRDLAEVVDCAGGGDKDRHHRAMALLRPMMMRDDHCQAAQGMLCRAIREKFTTLPGVRSHFHIASASRINPEIDRDTFEAVGRRMEMMLACVHAYLHDQPHEAWSLVERCTTADRLIVVSFTATMLHRAMSGRVLVDPHLTPDGDGAGGGQ